MEMQKHLDGMKPCIYCGSKAYHCSHFIDTYAEVADEFACCYPESWNDNSPTRRARLVAITWARDCLPTVKFVIANRKAVEAEKMRKAAEKKAKRAAKRKEHNMQMHHLVLRAMDYYGDICYEYSQQIWGDEGPELISSGAKWFTKDDEEMLKFESIFAAHGHTAAWKNDPDFADKVKKHWTKYFS